MRCRRQHYAVFISKNKVHAEDWETEKVRVVIAHSRWRPAADIYETESTIYITIELAGVDPLEIDIALYENALVVEGYRRLLFESKENGVYHAAEIRQGPFQLEVLLPTKVNIEQVDARYEQGLLKIALTRQ